MMRLIKSYPVGAAGLKGKHIAKVNGGAVETATAATDTTLGLSAGFDQDAGQMGDVILSGPGPVIAGGDIDFGDKLMTDAQGRAVKLVPAPGETVAVVGTALRDAAEGDIFDMHVSPSLLSTPA